MYHEGRLITMRCPKIAGEVKRIIRKHKTLRKTLSMHRAGEVKIFKDGSVEEKEVKLDHYSYPQQLFLRLFAMFDL